MSVTGCVLPISCVSSVVGSPSTALSCSSATMVEAVDAVDVAVSRGAGEGKPGYSTQDGITSRHDMT